MTQPLWLFGYGSLMWRPDFAYERAVRGFVRGWARRFWQASTDHRGVPDAPGRVVTLVERSDADCWGLAYQVAAEDTARVLAQLDHRERGGYTRLELDFHVEDAEYAAVPESGPICALAYIAQQGNPNYVGEAPLSAIAECVRRSRGPSGHNAEYVLRLAEALVSLNAHDEHVFALANLVIDTHPERDD